MSQNPLPVLHVWPKTESSVSTPDPPCVAALLYLQIYTPGQFTVQYCTNPDLSPSGQLPYLTHGLHSVAGFHAIVKYVAHTILRDPSQSLGVAEKAKHAARVAHVESSLGDLTAHVYYSLTANWVGKTRPALVSILPTPQRFYVPERIRLSHQPRLEAAGLWNIAALEQEEKSERERFSFRKSAKKNKKAEEKAKFKETLERNNVQEKARTVLNVYSRLLGNAQFFNDAEAPTILDIVLAAHIYLLKQDQPDPLIRDLLVKEYSSLVPHCDRVYAVAFPESAPPPAVVPHSSAFSLRSLLPASIPKPTGPKSAVLDEQARKFALIRRAFYGGTFIVVGAYIYHQRSAFVDLWRRLQLLLVVIAAQQRGEVEIQVASEDGDDEGVADGVDEEDAAKEEEAV